MNEWTKSGWAYRPTSVDDLTRAVTRLGTLATNRRYLWRGQADMTWPLTPSLARRLEAQGHKSGEHEVAAAEKSLIAEARRWPAPEFSGLHSDQQVLALLQHHGVAAQGIPPPGRLAGVGFTRNRFRASQGCGMGIRAGHTGLGSQRECLRAGCHQPIEYVPQQPPLYCSTGCRVAANREIAWLQAEADRLKRFCADHATTPQQRTEAISRASLVSWHLLHYAPALGR